MEIIFNGVNKELQLKTGKLKEKIIVWNELTVCSRYFFMSLNLYTVFLLKYVTSAHCPEKI